MEADVEKVQEQLMATLLPFQVCHVYMMAHGLNLVVLQINGMNDNVSSARLCRMSVYLPAGTSVDQESSRRVPTMFKNISHAK